MIHTIKRVHVLSVARQFFFLSLIPGFVAVLLASVTVWLISLDSVESILAMIVLNLGLPVAIAIAVAIGAGLLAILFNLSVKLSGGVKVYVETQESPHQYSPEKLKNLL